MPVPPHNGGKLAGGNGTVDMLQHIIPGAGGLIFEGHVLELYPSLRRGKGRVIPLPVQPGGIAAGVIPDIGHRVQHLHHTAREDMTNIMPTIITLIKIWPI